MKSNPLMSIAAMLAMQGTWPARVPRDPAPTVRPLPPSRPIVREVARTTPRTAAGREAVAAAQAKRERKAMKRAKR